MLLIFSIFEFELQQIASQVASNSAVNKLKTLKIHKRLYTALLRKSYRYLINLLLLSYEVSLVLIKTLPLKRMPRFVWFWTKVKIG